MSESEEERKLSPDLEAAFAEPENEDQSEAIGRLDRLVKQGRAQILPDRKPHWARLHLTMPIPAFPDKADSAQTIESLSFRVLTVGDVMEIDRQFSGDDEADRRVLGMIVRLTGLEEKHIKALHPRDWDAASVVAYSPLNGPAFRPVGSAS